MSISHSNDNATHSAKVTKKKPMDCLSFAAVFFCRDATIEVNPKSWTKNFGV